MTIERVYFDSSALVKVLVSSEAGAELASGLFHSGGRQYTSRLSRPETLSALSRRVRNREINTSDLGGALLRFEEAWQKVNVIPVLDPYVDRAAELVVDHSLSGADAVHLATALEMLQHAEVTFVTWDKRQAAGAAALGFEVQPPID
ncbi:MAG: type II toxin-antitoxin system VapC family toxin [Chloroflexi bacterium]|nr:type II toxin-antitoxin system VapC family toxin [Chloroflexota bacterium]